ncbi:11975_t:CDS:2 [Dentiscutata heterogama]|uniref:11975_t:CDS:1 n=1 Tax=Dentiscutata heterogama TaxID=1316150 RepID=A0ACA9K011_9GLOM|nr:11975_t:CDS:2 [Dentiscutata heterogama]
MDSFLLTDSLLRNLLRIQRYLQEFSAAIICITDDTIEFLDKQDVPTEITMASDINRTASNESRMHLFYKDLQRRKEWPYSVGIVMQNRRVHNILAACHLLAKALVAISKEEYTSLLEEAQRSRDKEFKHLVLEN